MSDAESLLAALNDRYAAAGTGPGRRAPQPRPQRRAGGYDATGCPGMSMVYMAVACWPAGAFSGAWRWVAEGIWLIILAGIIAGKRTGRRA